MGYGVGVGYWVGGIVWGWGEGVGDRYERVGLKAPAQSFRNQKAAPRPQCSASFSIEDQLKMHAWGKMRTWNQLLQIFLLLYQKFSSSAHRPSCGPIFTPFSGLQISFSVSLSSFLWRSFFAPTSCPISAPNPSCNAVLTLLQSPPNPLARTLLQCSFGHVSVKTPVSCTPC